MYSALDRNCASKYHAYDVNNNKLADRSVCMVFITNFYCRSSRRRILASSSPTPDLASFFFPTFSKQFSFFLRRPCKVRKRESCIERTPPRNNAFSASQRRKRQKSGPCLFSSPPSACSRSASSDFSSTSLFSPPFVISTRVLVGGCNNFSFLLPSIGMMMRAVCVCVLCCFFFN